MLSPNIVSYVASETIPAGARVKFVAGSAIRVELADAADAEIGTAILHSGKESYAADTPVGVKLMNDGGTRTCIAKTAIASGVTVYREANGEVNDAAGGDIFGVACEAASAGDFVEVLALSQSLVTPTNDSVTTAKILDDNVTVAKLSAIVRGESDGLGFARIARATFDPSLTAGERTVAAHTLGVTIPDNAVVTRFWYDVITTFTSPTADAASVAFHIEGAGDLVAAVTIADATNVLDAGIHAGKPGNPNLGADAAHDSQLEVAALVAATYIKTTAARLITATVAIEALTAGKAVLYVEYVPGA